MNPLLRFIYFILKLLTRAMFRIFYQKRIVYHKKGVRFQQPAILVSNHPNTMIDPLTIASLPQKQVFFLGNAGLFGTAFTHWFFSTFYDIPIMRSGDKSYKKVSNQDSFRKCYEHLAKGGAIYIAPEGGSDMGRQIRPFKTGTARIALEAEATNDFKLDLIIIPVGLTYDFPEKFGSRQIINIGEPIRIKNWKKEYLNAPIKTARRLTAELEDTVRSLTLNFREEDDSFCPHYAKFFKTEGILKKDLFGRLKQLEQILEDKNAPIRQKAETYFKQIDQRRISDLALFQNHHHPFTQSIKYILGISLGLPLGIYGGLNNFFVYFLPWLASKKIKIYPGYLSTVKILTGVVVLFLFYTLQYQLVKYLWGNPIAFYYLLSLLPLGLFAWKYYTFVKRGKHFFSVLGLSKKKKEELWKLREEQRAELQSSIFFAE